MTILAALGSAICFGTSDFMGGWASRRASSVVVTMWINAVALVTVAVACWLGDPELSSSQAIGALAGGFGAAVALNLIYAALAAGAMSLSAPLIACGSALVPTVTTIVIGQPPDLLQSVGIAFALGGVLAITQAPSALSKHVALSRRALGLTVLASVMAGVSMTILLLSAKGGASVALGVSGLARAAALCTSLLVVFIARPGFELPRPFVPRIFGAGLFEAAGTTLFLLASSLGNTAVVAVLVSLYAVVTILLAQTVLRERIAVHQGWGIAAATVGVALLSAG